MWRILKQAAAISQLNNKEAAVIGEHVHLACGAASSLFLFFFSTSPPQVGRKGHPAGSQLLLISPYSPPPPPFLLVLLEEVNNQYFSLREVICLSSGNCGVHVVKFLAAEVRLEGEGRVRFCHRAISTAVTRITSSTSSFHLCMYWQLHSFKCYKVHVKCRILTRSFVITTPTNKIILKRIIHKRNANRMIKYEIQWQVHTLDPVNNKCNINLVGKPHRW